MSPRLRWAAVALCGVLAGTGCGVSSQDRPQPIQTSTGLESGVVPTVTSAKPSGTMTTTAPAPTSGALTPE